MVTPVQQSAVDDIHKKLDSSGWLNTVTHSEMNDVAARLKGLSPADARAVVNELARTGDLKKLADEAVDGSWFGNGGYIASERTDLFNSLATKLDGQTLRKVSDAFAKTDAGGSDGYDRVNDLAKAIATHASADTKVQFVKALASETTDGKTIRGPGFGGSSMRDVDAEASAVGTVLGSLQGGQAEAAFKSLKPDQLRAVMRSGIDARLDTTAGPQGSPGTNVATWNTDNLSGVLKAASTVRDPDLKARIFDAGVDTMRTIRDTNGVFGGLTVVGKDQALTSVRDGLTRIIDSDTSGVVSELNRNSETRNGADLAAYAKEMLSSGQEAKLGQQMAKIQFGNNLNENAVDRLYQKEGVPGTPGDFRYPNAEALGYFIGAINKATTSISSDVTQQRTMTTNVLKSALTVIDKVAGKAYGGAVGITASVAKEWVQMGVQAAISDPAARAADRMEAAALPNNPATGESAVGTNIDEAFGAAVERVIRSDEI